MQLIYIPSDLQIADLFHQAPALAGTGMPYSEPPPQPPRTRLRGPATAGHAPAPAGLPDSELPPPATHVTQGLV